MHRDLTVLFLYASRWFGTHQPKFDLPEIRVSFDAKTLLSADCVVFHLPSLLSANNASTFIDLKKTTPARQVWLALNMESAANYSPLEGSNFMALFDGEISFRQTADVWVPYIPVETIGGPVPRQSRFRRGRCCVFQSSDFNSSGRQEYLRELMAEIPVASYGRFKRNRRIWFDRGRASKMAIMKRFDFSLAFENSIEKDYVTEKFFEPLIAGCVPVYLGAPNIDEFAPGDDCYVNVQDFANPKDLSEFLKKADVSHFQSWRQRPLRPQFLEKRERMKLPTEKRIAILIRQLVDARRQGHSPRA
jgi:hypothetical protein